MGIILILFFDALRFFINLVYLFFMYLHRSYGIVRIYRVLIAYSTFTHLVFETPLLQYIPLIECIQRLLLAKSTHHGDNIDAPITYIFSVLCIKSTVKS